MTLLEMSPLYEDSAVLLRGRLTELRFAARRAAGEEERRLRRRIAELEPLLRESRELAVLTARYYERGYHKNERYTL